MPYEWMLILVTAVAPTEYNVVALSSARAWTSAISNLCT